MVHRSHLAEAFNSLYKAELIRNKGPWTGMNDRKIATVDYIDWFNHRRLHGEIGHRPPVEVETEFLQRSSPATDPRARRVAESLRADPGDGRELTELAREAGSSPRTLLRIFIAETGMTFNQWRTPARIQAATGYLAEGLPVGRVSERVGYATPSAFVAAFHRVTGHTPTGYFGMQATNRVADTQPHGE